MAANTQTYPVAPSIELARMALALACQRVYNFTPAYDAMPLRRDDQAAVEGSCSFEYYAICDRISRGEAP